MGTEGVGLGLALSKGLVELMRGSLTAASVEGEGSCFYLELDQASIPSVTAGDETDLYDVFVDPISEYTILYVEDNVDNVRLVRQILKHRPSLRLLTAMQGSIGLDLAQQHHPKVILLDLHLPDIPGEEVLRRLKTMPETTSIPVIVLSADATQRQQQQLRRAGAWDYLTKPIHVRQFLSILEKAIQVGETEQ